MNASNANIRVDDEVDQLQELDLQVEINNNKKGKKTEHDLVAQRKTEQKAEGKGGQESKKGSRKFFIRNLSDTHVNLIHLFSEGQYRLGSMSLFIDRLQEGSVQGAVNVQSIPQASSKSSNRQVIAGRYSNLQVSHSIQS